MYNKKNKHYLQRPASEETTRPLHVRVTNKNKRVNGFENDVINIHETTKKKGYYGRTASAWQTTFRLDRETSLLIIVLSNHPVSYLQFQFISLDGLGTGHLSKAVCFCSFFPIATKYGALKARNQETDKVNLTCLVCALMLFINLFTKH